MADDATGEIERLRAARDQALHDIGLCLRMLLADFYEADQAELWMNMAHVMLAGKTPLAMVESGQTGEVLRLIGQLREGAYI